MIPFPLNQRVWNETRAFHEAHGAYALFRGFASPLIAALDAVPELDDRPRMALAATERWLDGALNAEGLQAAWRAVPLLDRHRGEASWHEAATAAFFYGNSATRHAQRLLVQYYEWSAVAMRLCNAWCALGEPPDAAVHRVLTSVRASLAKTWPPAPSDWPHEGELR